GLELAQKCIPQKLGLVVATYAHWDPAYWSGMSRRLRESQLPVAAICNLAPPEFLNVLADADFYVRATLTDGDAVAVREAGAMGARVLASDAAARPSGTGLFPAQCPDALAELIARAMAESRIGRLPAEAYA